VNTSTTVEYEHDYAGKLCIINNRFKRIGVLTGKVERHHIYDKNIKTKTLYSLYEVFIIINKKHQSVMLQVSDFNFLD
jgi:hypothetical protein